MFRTSLVDPGLEEGLFDGPTDVKSTPAGSGYGMIYLYINISN